jgi:hypothetical protein
MRSYNAEAQEKHRESRRNGGMFVKLDIYVHPLDKAEFKKLEAECRAKRLAEFNEENGTEV